MTGQSWLPELPDGWSTKPLRFLVSFTSGGTPNKGNSAYWSGDIAWVSPKDMKRAAIADSEDHITEEAREETNLSLMPPGSLLIVVRGMILAHSVPVALTTGPVTINQDMKALRCIEGIDPHFLLATFQGAESWLVAHTEEATHGTKRLETETLGRFKVPVPPVEVQRSIASYLDRETARIAALIAAKERVLGLLAEKRRALINRAATRGLDPHVPLRDSGIPWLGAVPAHWKVQRLKFDLHNIQQGWSPQCEAAAAGPEDWGVLKAGCVNGDAFNPEENKRLPDHEAPIPDLEVRPGDVLMSRANTTELLGSAAIVRDVRPRLLLCDKLYRLDVNTATLLKEFLVYFLRTPSGRFDFERTATGASNSMQNISQDVVRNVWLPVPPIEEQRTIVEHIVRETMAHDKVREATERTIALLKERRTALIAAAVTGRISVETTA